VLAVIGGEINFIIIIQIHLHWLILTSNTSFLSCLNAQYNRMKNKINIAPTSIKPIGFSHGVRNIAKLSAKSIVLGLTKKPPPYVPTCELTPTVCENDD